MEFVKEGDQLICEPLKGTDMSRDLQLKSGDSESDDSNQDSKYQSEINTPSSSAENIQESGLTKKQLKKLRKTQKWEERKLQKRAEERKRKKERRKEARQQGLEVAPSRKALKRITMAGSSCKVKVVIDCSFDDLMSQKDVNNIVRQLGHCYGVNRRVKNPLQFYVTSITGKLLDRLEAIKEYKYWDVNFDTNGYDSLFNKEDIVYLSSDSENVLQTLNEDKVYIIGGLVDHNHHKGLCLKLAQEKGIAHAKLPITEYVKFSTRKVLTVNQVFEILLAYTEKPDWENAFFKAIPKRKAPQVASEEKKLKMEDGSAAKQEGSQSDSIDENGEESSTANYSINDEGNTLKTGEICVSSSCNVESEKLTMCSASSGTQESSKDLRNCDEKVNSLSTQVDVQSDLHKQFQNSDTSIVNENDEL